MRRTPVTVLQADDLVPGLELVLKLEQLQHTWSGKARGAINRVLPTAERGEVSRAGVVAASAGTPVRSPAPRSHRGPKRGDMAE